jgi:hypothetical protein
MNKDWVNLMEEEQKLSSEEANVFRKRLANKSFSVYQDLQLIFYAAVLLLSTGFGILVYRYFGSLSQQLVLISLIVLILLCYAYCWKKAEGFSFLKQPSRGLPADYLLLLASLLMLSLVAYLQFQYHLFGERYGLASFLPMVVLFASAYYFDHVGVLALAIVMLGTWMGITVMPTRFYHAAALDTARLIFTGLALALLLEVAAVLSQRFGLKTHFSFTYSHFALHTFFLASLSGMFHFENYYWVWFVLLLLIGYYWYRRALALPSFYWLLITSIYVYIAAGYMVLHWLDGGLGGWVTMLYLGLGYLALSGILLVYFLMTMNKKIKVAHVG